MRSTRRWGAAAVAVLLMVPGLVLFSATPARANDFPDVPLGHPFFSEIRWMVEQQLSFGYPDHTFRPDAPVTRGALAAFLKRLNDRDHGPTGPFADPLFTDVSPAVPFYDEIRWLAGTGVTTGFPDGTFRPSAPVTRRAVATMLRRFDHLRGGLPPSQTLPSFVDVPSNDPFVGDIGWIAGSGIATGYADHTFRPAADLTRQAMAAFLKRFAALPTTDYDCATQTDVPAFECLALVRFYFSTGGPGWLDHTGWLGPADPCSWHGVTCSAPPAASVVGLALPGNQLQGTLPPSLGDLTHLVTLDLSYDGFTGPIPTQIENLTELVSLRVGQTQGAIPPVLGSLTHLKELSLRPLFGPIPPELGNLTALETLDLDGARVSGEIPPELGQLRALRTLDLNRNNLSGPLPPELGNLTHLRTLDLTWNPLSGPLPAELGNLHELEVAALVENGFTGPIPASFGGLAALRQLDLGWNELSGPIPAELGQLTNLEVLSLRNNQLSGPIPAALGNLGALTHLYLDDNALTGALPPELGNLTALVHLFVNANDLSGSIPPSLGNFANVVLLDLTDNAFTGVVPPELGKLGSVEELRLRNNALSGPLPVELMGLTKLTWITLYPNGCFTSSDPALTAWLDLHVFSWDGGCP